MDIKHLAEFVALAETGNYLETADNLFISQSTLSKHIMALEKELGVSLFERTTRKIHLSTEGETFLPYALKIVRLQEEAANVLSAHSKAATNRIALASTSQIVQYSVTEALAQFKRTHLSCQLNILVESHRNLKKLLYQHKADFIWIGETEEEAKDGDFVRMPFLAEPLVALIHHQHPLASRRSVTIGELCREELVMQDNTSIEQEVFVGLCRSRGLEPKLVSIPGGKVIVDFVKQQIGIAVMLKTPALKVYSPDISIVEIESSPIIHVNLLYAKGRRLPPIAREFLKFLEEWK